MCFVFVGIFEFVLVLLCRFIELFSYDVIVVLICLDVVFGWWGKL